MNTRKRQIQEKIENFMAALAPNQQRFREVSAELQQGEREEIRKDVKGLPLSVARILVGNLRKSGRLPEPKRKSVNEDIRHPDLVRREMDEHIEKRGWIPPQLHTELKNSMIAYGEMPPNKPKRNRNPPKGRQNPTNESNDSQRNEPMKNRTQTILEKVSEIIEGKVKQNVPLYPDPTSGSSQYERSPAAFALRLDRAMLRNLRTDTPAGQAVARFHAGEMAKEKEKVTRESGKGRVARQDLPRPDPITGRMRGLGAWSRLYPKTDPYGGVRVVPPGHPDLELR